MALRIDRVKVNISRLDADTGRFYADATIARAGVQKYSDGQKEWYEFRPPEEVEKSAASFNDAFITVEHPPVFVNAANSRQYTVGLGKDCKFDGGLLKSPLIVIDADAAIKAHTSHKEISCGYDATVVDKPGIWVDSDGLMGIPGKSYKYDKVQTDIKGNHIAFVANGTARAGPIARVHTDSEEENSLLLDAAFATGETVPGIPEATPDALPEPLPIPEIPLLQDSMKKTIKIGGTEYEVDANIADAYNKMMAGKKDSADPATPQATTTLQIDGLVTQLIESSRKDADTYKAQLELANTKIAELSTAQKSNTDSQQMEVTLQERVDAFQQASPWLAPNTAFNVSIPAIEWQRIALKNAAPQLSPKFDSMNAEQIGSTFDYQVHLSQSQQQQQPVTYADQAQIGLIAAQNQAAVQYQYATQDPQQHQDAMLANAFAAQQQAYVDAQTQAHNPNFYAAQALPPGFTYDSNGILVQSQTQPQGSAFAQ